MKIYQVEITCAYVDCTTNNFETYLFTNREKAIACVNKLYEKRFDTSEDWMGNPFSEYDEEEQSHVNEKKVIEDGKITSFELEEMYDCTFLSVYLHEKETDTNEDQWYF